jgi:16S rRNA (uracil1498-N3)-methyltransferase
MNIRLYLDCSLTKNQKTPLDKKQAHYLKKVLRLKEGTKIFVFNSRHGEFEAEILNLDKTGIIEIKNQTKPHSLPANINLVYAPVKNVKSEYLVTKATELGVRSISPVSTKRTVVNRVNQEKLTLCAIEAAEQCERVDIPKVSNLTSLKNFLDNLKDEHLIFADESLNYQNNLLSKILTNAKKTIPSNSKIYVLTGPEGGFSESERTLIKSYKNTISITLGNRILRADTAIMTALFITNHYLGDIT